MIERIATYWDGRSASWLKERKEAWSRPKTERWLEFFHYNRSKTL
ncbi:hypothetical protein [Sphingobacterium sp.]